MTSEVDTDSSPDEYAAYHSILESGRQHSRNIHMYFLVFFKFKTGSETPYRSTYSRSKLLDIPSHSQMRQT